MAGDAVYLKMAAVRVLMRRCRLALGAGAAALLTAAAPIPLSAPALDSDIRAYDALGVKQTGSSGNLATLRWLRNRLTPLGYAVEISAFAQPTYRIQSARVTVGGAVIDAFPLSPPRFTGAGGVNGPLVAWDGRSSPAGAAGAAALLVLPQQRHSSVKLSLQSVDFTAAQRAGVAAIIIVTRGPTGDLIALNADAEVPLPPLPFVLVAGREAERLQASAAQHQPVRVQVSGEALPAGRARNLIARRVRGPNWTIISTPVSGWFHAAAERGPGVAIFLGLAARLAAAAPCDSIALHATSGHEAGYGGMAAAIDAGQLPPPAAVRQWVHLGAGLAAFDLSGRNPEPARYVLATAPMAAAARAAFAGVPGYQVPYVVDRTNAVGESEIVIARGYTHVVGAVSAHAYHHSPNDRSDRTSGALTAPVAAAFDQLVKGAIAPGTCG